MRAMRSLKRATFRFLREYRDGLLDLLMNADTRYTEVVSSLLLVGWGLVLAFPARSDAGVSGIQSVMQMLAPTWVWAVFIILLGLLEGLGATMPRFYPLRVMTGAIAGPCWLLLSVVIVASGYRTIGSLAYALLAALVSWAYVRLGAGTLRSPTLRAARKVAEFVRQVRG